MARQGQKEEVCKAHWMDAFEELQASVAQLSFSIVNKSAQMKKKIHERSVN